ncbi:MAG: hypothetical protein P8174_02300 [Gemmatimonadota bacterium]|jgi:maltose-binding protein MalE
MRTKMVALAALAVLGTTACASAGGQAAMRGPAPKSNAPVQLTVRNDNEHAVDVFAMVKGTYEQMLRVPPMETRNMSLPPKANMENGVRLKVTAVGSGETYSTNAILLNPGQGIDLTVASSVNASSWAVD